MVRRRASPLREGCAWHPHKPSVTGLRRIQSRTNPQVSAQGQAIEPIPGVVELWQAEEGELLLPAQVRGSGAHGLAEPLQQQKG
uniref:Uncharacterized protein n=1 Tax=Anas platyrhynchos platyrhynchos TaxID=8840 RepID=A0A493TP98_ANAPP